MITALAAATLLAWVTLSLKASVMLSVILTAIVLLMASQRVTWFLTLAAISMTWRGTAWEAVSRLEEAQLSQCLQRQPKTASIRHVALIACADDLSVPRRASTQSHASAALGAPRLLLVSAPQILAAADTDRCNKRPFAQERETANCSAPWLPSLDSDALLALLGDPQLRDYNQFSPDSEAGIVNTIPKGTPTPVSGWRCRLANEHQHQSAGVVEIRGRLV
jgi:hypothetical protein